MAKKDTRTWWDRLHELLWLYGQDKLTAAQFWAQMRQHGLTDADIDRYCRGEK